MVPMFSPDGTRIAYTAVGPKFLWNTLGRPVLGRAIDRTPTRSSSLMCRTRFCLDPKGTLLLHFFDNSDGQFKTTVIGEDGF